MDENKNKFLLKSLLEGVVIFCLLTIGLIIETFQRGILLVERSLNMEVLELILSKAFIITLIFVLSYRVAKSVFYPLYKILLSKSNEFNSSKILSFFTDVFLITALILISISIRPVIQETSLESNIEGFQFLLVKHDALFSIITLFIISVPLIYFIYKIEKSNKIKNFKIIIIVLIICTVGVTNGISNYSARISETRANWIKQDWQKQSEEAQTSLKNAKTDEEKAVAYYWLGVAENRQKNFEKAKEYQLKAIELWSEYDAAHASLANAYIHLGEIDKSLEYSQRCIEINPNYAWCYQSLMNYYLTVGDIESAKINAKKATELNPENKELESIYKELLEY
jgi:tetratricopeptide (TPR) repeat protein